ncbi:MAG TPA: T9SS type A sorting domain-containing protein [Candidatus Krumholzibacteria bacterium]
MKFNRARILSLSAALLCVAAATSHAVRPTPAFRSADAKIRVTTPAPAVSRGLNEFQRDRLAASRAGMSAALAPGATGALRVGAFVVQFTDTVMAASRDSTWLANELGHVTQYYDGASRGRLDVQPAFDPTVRTLAHKMSYYGSDATEDTRVVDLAAEVIAMVDAQVDFSQFDLVFIIHAGAGQETDIGGDSPIQIWSSFYDRGDIRRAQEDKTSRGLATNDTKDGQPYFVDNFAIVPARASQDNYAVGTLGIWAYQVGNRIGLVPLFDSTPDGAPDAQGVGGFCLMGYGLFQVNGFIPAFPCSYNRMLAGWVDAVVVDPSSTPLTVNLSDINTGADTDTVLLKVPVTESEYYLVDNRVHDTNADSLFTFTDDNSDLIPDNAESLQGAEFDFFLTDLSNPYEKRKDPRYPIYNNSGGVLFRYTGSGMYVWHIDEGVIRDAVEHGYLPDDYAARKGVDLEEADGVQDMDRIGSAVFSLGSFFDSYREGDGNQAVFGPKTKPASVSNSGAVTGIEISTTSPAGLSMRVGVRRELAYSDIRVRWDAASPGQPATPVDLDGDGSTEIVVLSDSAGVFVFNRDGTEWVDGDANPATIEPRIPVPGITWAGPPAFGNLDGGADIEIVAAATSGSLFAWKPSGTQVFVYTGLPMVAPPMLLDVNGGAPEIVIAEQQPATVRLSVLDATGAPATVAPLLASQWPHAIPGQRAAPLAEMRIKDGDTTTIGVAAAVLDTTASRMSFTWIPVAFAGTTPSNAPLVLSQGIGRPSGPDAINSLPSAPAVGDIDHDEDDEAVVTTPAGDVIVIDYASAFSSDVITQTGELRAGHPSAPALGDVDGDGVMEIAVWDDEYMYLLESNARPMVNWPRRIRAESAGEAPQVAPVRQLQGPLVFALGNGGGTRAFFPLDDGTLFAFDAKGAPAPDYPRATPAGAGAAPSMSSADNFDALVFLGSSGRVRTVDAVTDSVGVASQTVLSIQDQDQLPVPAAINWRMWRVDLARTGRLAQGAAGVTPAAGAYDQSTFMIYPNPVKEGTVHARVNTNARATVSVSVYTLEGQEALSRSFSVNPNSLPNTPFDEAMDVAGLKSGVYLLRLRIESSAGSGSLVKTFAIRR